MEINQVAENPALLSRKELAAKADEIMGIYVAKKRYKLYKAMVEYMKAGKQKPLLKSAYDYPYELSSDEIWVLVMNPNNVLATKRASEQAVSYTVEAYGRQGWLDKPDANRHAIWNSLIASYNPHSYTLNRTFRIYPVHATSGGAE